MGLVHSPRIVTDGLALSLDASNTKSYNVGISTNWIDVFGGNSGTLLNGTYHTDGPFPGAGYVEFDGTSDYLDIGSSADFAFGTGDFTIEVWVYLKANSVGVIYSNEVSNSLFLYLSSGNLVVRNYGTSDLFNLAGPSLNTWTHIALSRSGTDLRLFFNGVQQGGTVTNSTNWTQNGAEIGAYGNGTQSLNGYMSNLRVVKGTALYTAAFTPPTKPLTDISGTKLLTCQGSTITAAGISTHTITVNGNASAKLGFPESALVFDGSNDYVNAPVTKTASCTFSCWAKSTNVNGKMLFNAGGSGPDLFFYNSNVSWNTFDGDDNAFASTPASVTDGNWHYYVVVNDASSNAKLYYDGELLGTATYKDASASTTLTIGGYTNTYMWDGSISSFQLHNKVLTAAEVQQNYNALKGRYA